MGAKTNFGAGVRAAMDFRQTPFPARLSQAQKLMQAAGYGPFQRLSLRFATSASPDNNRLAAILQAVEGERVTAIAITHHHSDHSPLAGPLKAATGATIYGCAVIGHEEADTGEVKMEAGHDHDFKPDVSVCGGGTIAGPGWTLEAIPTPGHTSNHLCYGLQEENACFTGDHIMGWSTTVITPPPRTRSSPT
jgi:glyoxylase-like metal-dependent hydrolase (beta-lactamase superfamily II)